MMGIAKGADVGSRRWPKALRVKTGSKKWTKDVMFEHTVCLLIAVLNKPKKCTSTHARIFACANKFSILNKNICTCNAHIHMMSIK